MGSQGMFIIVPATSRELRAIGDAAGRQIIALGSTGLTLLDYTTTELGGSATYTVA